MLTRKFRKETGIEIPFCKPKNSNPTRHLYVTNCPIPGGQDIKEHPLYPVCSANGRVETIFSVPTKPLAFISFSAVEHAVCAAEALRAGEGGAGLHVQFAEKAEPRKKAAEEPIPCPSDSEHIEVPGFQLLHDFVSKEEADAILDELKNLPWRTNLSRRVQHYGFEFDYVTRKCSDRSTPPMLTSLQNLGRRGRASGAVPFEIDQCTVNEYLPGQGIRSHVDTHSAFEDGILSVALCGSTVLEMKHPSGLRKHIEIPARSAFAITGPARYQWAHAIACRKYDRIQGELRPRQTRISLTFRTVRFEPCRCEWALQCDSQHAPIPQSRKVKSEPAPLPALHNDGRHAGAGDSECGAPDIEKVHVHALYDAIAPHFSATRYKPWPRVEAFLRSLPPGSVVADVGCGNGRYLNCSDSLLLASDRSSPLAAIAAARSPHAGCVMVADALDVPLRSSAFPAAISIAVLHHLSTAARRRRAIEELKRVVEVGGQILVYAWAKEQGPESRFKFHWQDLLVPWHLPRPGDAGGAAEAEGAVEQKEQDAERQLPEHSNGDTGGDEPEREGGVERVDEKEQRGSEKELEGGGQQLDRYCHVYVAGELTQLCEEVGGLRVDEEYWDCSNYAVRCTRLE